MKLTTTRLRQIIKEEMYRMSRTPSRRLKEARRGGIGSAYSAALELLNGPALPSDLRAALEVEPDLDAMEGGIQFAIGMIGAPHAGESWVNLHVFTVRPASEGTGYADATYESPNGGMWSVQEQVSDQILLPVEMVGGRYRIAPEGLEMFESQLGDIADFAWLPVSRQLVRSGSYY